MSILQIALEEPEEPKPDICPVCNMQKPVNGECCE